MAKLGASGPFLYSEANGRLLGVINADGTERRFPLTARMMSKPDLAIFSDSFGTYDQYITSTAITQGTGGLWHWVFGMIGHHRIGNVIYSGVGGNTAALMRARYESDIQNKKHQILFGNCGANDFFGSVSTPTAEAVLADVLYIIDDQLSRGVIVFWATAPLQGSSRTNFTVAKQKETLRYNELLKDAALTRPGLTICPLAELIRDSNDVTNYGPSASMLATADGIHLTHGATLRFARANYDSIEALFPHIPRPFSQADGTTQSWSNSLLADGIGQFAGTGGTKGTGVSGGSVVPTGWTVTGTASTTVDTQKIASTDGRGDWFEVKITMATGVTTPQNVSINTASFHSLVPSGSRPALMFEMQLDDSGGATFTEAQGRQYNVVGGLVRHTLFNSITNGIDNLVLDGQPVTVSPITHPFTFSTGLGLDGAPTASQVYFDIKAKNLTAGSAYVIARFRNVKPFLA